MSYKDATAFAASLAATLIGLDRRVPGRGRHPRSDCRPMNTTATRPSSPWKIDPWQ